MDKRGRGRPRYSRPGGRRSIFMRPAIHSSNYEITFKQLLIQADTGLEATCDGECAVFWQSYD